MTDQPKAITVTNYDKIKALAHNQATITRFSEMLGSKPHAISYISSAMLAVANSNDLMECTPSSVFNSVMRAAALRLSCDPAMKQAHIVPYYNKKLGKREAQFIPGYVGLNQMAMRTGKYRVLNCSYIREGQVIDIDELTGVPNIHGQRTGDTILGYFHYFELFDGFKHILYMTVAELKAHGEKYAASNPLWKSNFDAMARKTVTRLHLLRNGILDPYDRTILEAAAEDIPQDGEIMQGNTVEGSFSEVDDETAAAEAAARKIEEANAPRKSEAELMAEITGEPAPKPTAPAAPVVVEAPEQPAAKHVTYDRPLSKLGENAIPAGWASTLMQHRDSLGGNMYEIGGVVWKLNIPQETTPARVVEMVKEYLAQQ